MERITSTSFYYKGVVIDCFQLTTTKHQYRIELHSIAALAHIVLVYHYSQDTSEPDYGTATKGYFL